jgi:putative phage-type endonuclease
MAITVTKLKNHADWLKEREGGIGSSEIATIVGLNPFETPYQLWRRKIGLDEPIKPTFAMKAGNYLEDAVSLFWQDETGNEVIKSSAELMIISNDIKPFTKISPDRTFWLKGQKKNNENKGILECKTTQMPIDENDLPKHWFVQLQYQLGVAEMNFGSLAWLTQGREFGYKELKFVPDFFDWLIEEADKFWTDNIVGKKEPNISTVQDVLLKYNKHTAGKTIEVDNDIFETYLELKDVRAQLSEIEDKKTKLEDKIKLCFGDAEAISFEGQTLATWKASKDSERFDSKAFQTAHPDLAKEFTTIVAGSRRFLVK